VDHKVPEKIEHPNGIELLELVSTTDGNLKHVVLKKRLMVGRSLNCDIQIESKDISNIHAVLEFNGNRGKLYDMNSANGCSINGEKKTLGEFKLGDTLSFANLHFKFQEHDITKSQDYSLEILRPDKVLEAKKEKRRKGDYPLAKDPLADHKEYIFEESEDIYPIFDYEKRDQVAEVVILSGDEILSIDYLPKKDSTYNLRRNKLSDKDIYFPDLPNNKRVPLVKIKGESLYVHSLKDFKLFLLHDHPELGKQETALVAQKLINLDSEDVIRFSRGDLHIFIRKVSAPPKTEAPPFLGRDHTLKKFIGIMLFVAALILTGLEFISENQIEKEVKEEKQLKRIAKIFKRKKKTPIRKPKKAKRVFETPTDPSQVTKTKQKNQTVVAKETKQKFSKVEKRSQKSGQLKTRTARRKVPLKKSRGRVEAYKGFKLKSNIHSHLVKSGRKSPMISRIGKNSDLGLRTKGIGSFNTGNLKKSLLKNPTGNLSDTATGTLSSSVGAEGLINKKGIATASVPADIVMLGSIDPEKVLAILRENLPRFQYCYQSFVGRDEMNKAAVSMLNFTIGASGFATKAAIGSKFKSRKFSSCMTKVLRGIQFPRPKGGGQVDIRQPIHFQQLR